MVLQVLGPEHAAAEAAKMLEQVEEEKKAMEKKAVEDAEEESEGEEVRYFIVVPYGLKSSTKVTFFGSLNFQNELFSN